MRTASSNDTLRTRLRRVIGKAAFALVLVGAMGAAPAMAQEWHGDRGDRGYHDGWRAHEEHARWEREHYEHRGYWDHGWGYRPRVYYAPPPPVYYAPAPAYYPGAYYNGPSVSVEIPFGNR